SLAGAKWFSTLDMAAGYWQVGLSPEDRAKTAFSTGKGLHQFKVMAMGLRNASSTFQRLMELVLSGLDTQNCLVYLDDIILFNKTEEEHLATLREVFGRIRQANLKLKPQKCSLARRQVVFLGHQISADGVQPDPRNIEKVLNWPMPATGEAMQSFLGLCGYYARFVKGYAELVRPLREAALAKGELQWTEAMSESFVKLRSIMASPPVLSLPSFQGEFVLYTDACNASVGSVLAERVNQVEKVIAYDSKVLTKQEAKWSTYDKELWAVVHGIRRFRQYVLGAHFTVVTDHKPLQNIPGSIAVERDGTGRRGRWAVELSSYDFEVTIKPGVKHANADALSRHPGTSSSIRSPVGSDESQDAKGDVKITDCDGVDEPGGLPTQPQLENVPSDDGQRPSPGHVATVNCNDTGGQPTELGSGLPSPSTLTAREGINDRQESTSLQDAQENDPSIKRMRTLCECKSSPNFRQLGAWGKLAKANWERIKVVDGVVGISTKGGFRAFLPKERRSEAISMAHAHPTCGHMGTLRTKLRVKQRFAWPGWDRDVVSFCEQCVTCQRRLKPSRPMRAPMITEIMSRPFERIAMDVTEMPMSAKGNKYALVIMDYFSKFVRIYPMPDQKTETIMEGLLDWVYDLGVPERIHSDQGRQFESNLFQGMCHRLGIHKTRTTPY
ncbi:MAG: reverse transcriptase domain-containing protein, partial [Cyanobacteria bacterium J06598_3]